MGAVLSYKSVFSPHLRWCLMGFLGFVVCLFYTQSLTYRETQDLNAVSTSYPNVKPTRRKKTNMNNNFRKIRKNAKALSPVVASIILIAVTVAVSVAVAAWMGGMTLGFMNTEQLKITNAAFTTDGEVDVTMQNTGSNALTITSISVASTTISADPSASPSITWSTGASAKIAANTGATATVPFEWENGGTYQIKVITSQGNSFTYQASAPTS